MSLETCNSPDQLYRARGDEVSEYRPLFTGDALEGLPLGEAGTEGLVLVLGHPCAIRAGGGQLKERLLVATIDEHQPLAPERWTSGHYAKMPLPDLIDIGHLHVALFDDLFMASTDTLDLSRRVACLSDFGVNLLQQRLVWHLTRTEVATFVFHDAFAHTLEEADLLEEWNETVCGAGVARSESEARFEEFIRRESPDGRTLQNDLKDPQRRSAVRRACRGESLRIAEGRDEQDA